MSYKSCMEQSVLTLTSKTSIFGEFIKNRNFGVLTKTHCMTIDSRSFTGKSHCKLNPMCLFIKLNIVVFVVEYHYLVALRHYIILKYEYNTPIMDGWMS